MTTPTGRIEYADQPDRTDCTDWSHLLDALTTPTGCIKRVVLSCTNRPHRVRRPTALTECADYTNRAHLLNVLSTLTASVAASVVAPESRLCRVCGRA